MHIYPKCDDAYAGLNQLKRFIHEGIEIQLGMKSPDDIKDVLENYKKEIPSLKEITIHLNGKEWDFDDYLYNKENLSKLVSYITALGYYQKELKIKLNLLLHLEESYEHIIARGGAENLNIVISYLDKHNVLLLLENVLSVSGAFDEIEHVSEFVHKVGNKHIMYCLDICHVYCYINKLGLDVEDIHTYLDKSYLNKITYQIHFSDTLNNDGFKDISTHSKAHTRERLYHDLQLLNSFKLADKILVTEIMEEDYNQRYGQVQELSYLSELIV